MGKIFHTLLIVIIILAASCKNEGKEQKTGQPANGNSKSMIDIHKSLLKKDRERIINYVHRRNWDMKETKSGLWYQIYEQGAGEKTEEGKKATVTYTVSLLDGTICYKTSPQSPKTFIVGQGGVESGLEEGIKMLHEGDKARFIMPPHLAHGLLGDENKIPPRSVIVYDLHLIDVSEKN
jgi:FKBP-type peptidyl-prolyl cis-trans isomerase